MLPILSYSSFPQQFYSASKIFPPSLKFRELEVCNSRGFEKTFIDFLHQPRQPFSGRGFNEGNVNAAETTVLPSRAVKICRALDSRFSCKVPDASVILPFINLLFLLQVAARAGVYDVLNQLGFSEFEDPRDTVLSRLRYRWRQHTTHTLPFRGEFM